MPSYLEKEQILPIQPHIANTAAILNTFQTKVQYWGAGAAQAKSAHERYLGMDLLREDNQGKLREFMTAAKDQLKKAVQTDLSVGDNQARVMNIYDPLVNGQSEFSKNILGDNSLASHYKSQFNTAESYRTRDNGKQYSDTNVRHLANHVEDFKNEKDPAAWRNYYNNRRFYTPYYDYNKEVREIMEAYKPSNQMKQVPTKGMYFHTVEDKSTTSSDALRYINANLSQEARRQMGIEASVNFHGREEDLIKSVRADWDADIAKYRSYSDSLEAEIRLEKDPIKKAELESERSLTEKRIGNLKSNIDTFVKGDYSEIIKNKDTYANKLYTDNLLSSIASGYSRTDYSEKYTVDQAAVATMNETGRNLRFQMQLEYDKERDTLDRETSLEIAKMRSDGTSKDTPGSPTFAIPKIGDTEGIVPLTEDDKKNYTVSNESLDSDLKTQNAVQKEIYGVIHDRLVSAGKIGKSDDPKLRSSVVETYIKDIEKKYVEFMKVAKDPSVVKGLLEREYFPGVVETLEKLKETNQVIYSISKVKDKLAENTKGTIKTLYEKGMTTVNYVDDAPGKNKQLVISPEVISNFVFKNDRSVIKEQNYEVTVPVTRMESTGDGKIAMPTGEYKKETRTGYFYNGRMISDRDVNKIVSMVNKSVEQKFDADLVQNRTIWKFGPNSDTKLKVAKQEVLNSVTHEAKELKEADFQVIGYSEDGYVYFKGDGGIKGGERVSKDIDDKRFVYRVPTSVFKIDVSSALPANAQGLKYFFDKQIPFLSPGKTLSTPSDRSFFEVGDVRYRVEAEKNADGSVTYNLYDLDNGKFITREFDFYSLVTFANTYPFVKNQTR
jgi:hypothetical protein